MLRTAEASRARIIMPSWGSSPAPFSYGSSPCGSSRYMIRPCHCGRRNGIEKIRRPAMVLKKEPCLEPHRFSDRRHDPGRKTGPDDHGDGGFRRDRARSCGPAWRPASRRARSEIFLIFTVPTKRGDIQRLALETSRLQIPLLLGLDIIHGHRTLFPIPLGEAAAVRSGLVGSDRARGREGRRRRWPAHDLRADAGCGARSALGPQRRRPGRRSLCRPGDGAGQGDGLPGREPGRRRHAGGLRQALLRLWRGDWRGANMPPPTCRRAALREVYLPPFEAAVAAGVATIMPAFTDLDGMPMSAHRAAADRTICATGWVSTACWSAITTPSPN